MISGDCFRVSFERVFPGRSEVPFSEPMFVSCLPANAFASVETPPESASVEQGRECAAVLLSRN